MYEMLVFLSVNNDGRNLNVELYQVGSGSTFLLRSGYGFGYISEGSDPDPGNLNLAPQCIAREKEYFLGPFSFLMY